MDSFGGLNATREVEIDLITDAYRISGVVQTPFGRVTDILNQLLGQHLTVEHATLSEHADPSATLAAPSAIVDAGLDPAAGRPRPDRRRQAPRCASRSGP